MRTLLNAADRSAIIERLRRLGPAAARRWGKMSAGQMIAHLTDQMTHTLGHVDARQQKGWRRNALIKYLAIYVVPWPKGRIKGPADAFVTQPADWDRDLERLVGYVEEFGAKPDEHAFPPHAMFGQMTRKDWGAFCWKHFDHHLRQFGV